MIYTCKPSWKLPRKTSDQKYYLYFSYSRRPLQICIKNKPVYVFHQLRCSPSVKPGIVYSSQFYFDTPQLLCYLCSFFVGNIHWYFRKYGLSETYLHWYVKQRKNNVRYMYFYYFLIIMSGWQPMDLLDLFLWWTTNAYKQYNIHSFFALLNVDVMYKRSIIRFNLFSNDIISVILLNYISKVNRIVYRAYTDIVNSGDSLKLIAILPTTIPQTRHLISCGIQWMFDQIIASLKYSLYGVPNFLWFLRWCFRAVIRSPKLNKMNKTRRFSFIASRDNTQTTSYSDECSTRLI